MVAGLGLLLGGGTAWWLGLPCLALGLLPWAGLDVGSVSPDPESQEIDPQVALSNLTEVLGASGGALYYRSNLGRLRLLVSHGFPLDTNPDPARLREVLEGNAAWLSWNPKKVAQQLADRFEGNLGHYAALSSGRPEEFQLLLECCWEKASPSPDFPRGRLLLESFATSLRRQAIESALTRQRQFSRAVLAEMVDGVFTLDQEGRVVLFNAAAEKITGWSSVEIRGRLPDDLLKFSEPLLPGNTSGESRELTIETKGGWERILRLHLRPPSVPFPDFAWIVVFRDVSRQRELEKLRLDFTTTLSHELRTPLTGVKGYLHTLMHKKARNYTADQIQSNLAIINHQVDRLSKLIGDLLEAARLGNQTLEVHPRTGDLRPSLERLMSEYRELEPGFELELACNETLVCRCDAEQVIYVVDHLLSNAVKYSIPGGKIAIRCKLAEGQLKIAVQDEGVGIPLEQQEQIFDMYHRVRNEDARIHYGMGLGLYIARKVMQAHGGRLEVESVPGCGSTFTLTVPQTE